MRGQSSPALGTANESVFLDTGGRLRRVLESTAGYVLVFAALFLAAWVPTLVVLGLSDRSFFWGVDGLSQQYVWFVYTGQWLRELFSNIFITHTFAVPMWTMDSGYGTDTIQALVSNVANPFYAVSAFVPEAYAEVAFEAMMVLQVFLGGLTFSAWCLHHGASRPATLVGALCYALAGNLVVIFSQPGFLFDTFAFPLLLLAADRVFERRGAVAFIAMIAWYFLYSFYDAYMACILLALYCLWRFFFAVDAGRPRRGRALRLLGWVGVFLGYLLLGVLISCALMLPQVMALVGSERLDLDRDSSLLYILPTYVNFFTRYTSSTLMGSDAYVGVNALAPIALLLLVLRRREHKGLLLAFVVLTVMLIVPIFGRIMNAMEYPTDRWSWAYGMLVAWVIVKMLPGLFEMGRRERRVVAVGVLVYVVLCVGRAVLGHALPILGQMAVLVLMLGVVLCAARVGRRVAYGLLVASVALSGCFTFLVYVAPWGDDWVANLVPAGTAWEKHATGNAAALVDDAVEAGAYDETYRYDRSSDSAFFVHNSNLITGHMTPDFYNSIYNQGIDDLNTSLGLIDMEGVNNRYGSLNSRGMLDALLGVRYFYARDRELAFLPKSFRDAETIATGAGASLLETDDVAPLAFVSDAYLTRERYESLSMIDRQKALMQGIVLEDAGEATGEMTDVGDDLSLDAQTLPYEVASTQNCSYDAERGVVKAYKPGARMTLAFDSPADAEAYLVVRGYDFHAMSNRERLSEEEWDGLSAASKLKFWVSDLFGTQATTFSTLYIHSEANSNNIFYPNAADAMYGGKHDWAANLGYSADGLTSVTLEFRTQGVYSLGELSIVAQPMADFDEDVAAMKDAGARDIAIGTNEIMCTADADRDARLFLSVAYSDGWSATVDGKPAAIHKADLGFMSVDVPAGEHEVQLTYVTPYLAEGAVLSAVGVVAAVVVGVLGARRRRAGERRAGDEAAHLERAA